MTNKNKTLIDIYHDGYGWVLVIDGGFVGRFKTRKEAIGAIH